jgi:dihydrofolate reductase
MALHEWMFKLPAWRGPHGEQGGEANASNGILKEATEGIGATLMGRNMFGGGPGPWGEEPWSGWWGEEPPFHTPVFVLTHHEREPLEMKGDTTFTFVTTGVESAVEMAKKAAAGADVRLAGGAGITQQCLAAGLVDELGLNVVPILLGDGTRLFDNLEGAAIGLELDRLVGGPNATHLRYRVAS